MVGYLPPETLKGTAQPRELSAGTRLCRVHTKSPKWGSTDFNATEQDPHFEGSRFDGTADDPYAYYYAALSMHTAMAEIFLRNLPFDHSGRMRIVQKRLYAGRVASTVRLTRPVRLISLGSTRHLNAIGQTNWLVRSSPEEYGKTRRWAHWLRGQVDWAQGLIWHSQHDEPFGEAVVLFGDRCGLDDQGPILEVDPDQPSIDFDDESGLAWLQGNLRPFNATVVRPRSPAKR